VKKQQDANPQMAEMSSTVVCSASTPKGARRTGRTSGDSRLFHFRRGVGTQLTKDHSVLQSFEDAGVVLPGSPKPDRSVLYAADRCRGRFEARRRLEGGLRTAMRSSCAPTACGTPCR
jgi:serine/threonine protein phosphatase PrpC